MVDVKINRTVLPSGLTVISEQIPSVRSVSIGVWVKTGTRFETPEKNGIAHFLEHMMFKGTPRRTPLEIAQSLESVGGHLNAYTSKDLTCYYAEVLDEHLPRAIDVLSDILLHSRFPEAELEKERLVILDEIQSLEDSPDELIQDYLSRVLFPEHPLGCPILGDVQTVSQLTRTDLLEFYRQFYFARNVVISAAGNLDHNQLVEWCTQYFDFPETNHPWSIDTPERNGQGRWIYPRPINQTHICVGFPALPYNDPRKYELLVLNTVLGGGMSSRLFQNIREKHGVAYSIYSYIDTYYDTGLLSIYLGTDLKNMDRAERLLEQELEALRKAPLSADELQQTKSQLKGSLMLGLESTARRMSRLGRMEIYTHRLETIDAVLDAIDRVDRESVWELTRQILDPSRQVKVMFVPRKAN